MRGRWLRLFRHSAASLCAMPRYEFRCRDCEQVFEISRPMDRSGEPAACPDGHTDTVRLLSAVAVTGAADAAVAASPAGGGCCGGACGCG